jgi:large subunit ribosomal protein L25
MANPVLNARTRQSTGKGAARTLRRNNQIPAIFYGPNREPLMLAMDTQTWNAMLKDLQVDPIKDTYLHVDFYEISMDKEITVPVPIHLVNTPLGVEEGGILQHVRREMNVSCLPDKLIEAFEVDVSQLQIGDSVHIRDIALPEGITCLDEENLTVAVVAAPTVEPEVEVPEEEELEEGVEEEAAEGEEGEKMKAEEEKAEAESESSTKGSPRKCI